MTAAKGRSQTKPGKSVLAGPMGGQLREVLLNSLTINMGTFISTCVSSCHTDQAGEPVHSMHESIIYISCLLYCSSPQHCLGAHSTFPGRPLSSTQWKVEACLARRSSILQKYIRYFFIPMKIPVWMVYSLWLRGHTDSHLARSSARIHGWLITIPARFKGQFAVEIHSNCFFTPWLDLAVIYGI